MNELSVINEVAVESQKGADVSIERSHDSGVASENSGITESENSGTAEGNVNAEKHIIILFEALNTKPATMKESTFVASSSNNKGGCNISAIGPIVTNNTISDDGKFYDII